MTMRTFVIGALSAAVALTIFAASDAASAAPRKPGGVGICISVPPPDCNFFLRPVCTSKSACGGCLKWACRLDVGATGKKKS